MKRDKELYGLWVTRGNALKRGDGHLSVNRTLFNKAVGNYIYIFLFFQTLKTSSPYLDRRLAEAKERQSKRAAAMKDLDTDFSKAKEIMKKYKSTENLLTITTPTPITTTTTTNDQKPLRLETDV